RHVITHLRMCFAIMGVPLLIKTDNAPSYTSQALSKFLQKWGISHSTGIPHSPTGQAIVEHTHKT
ncbi:POK6 protein, partial [Amazona guildingii]|nr:POK6 protein [Amazona guildingii]